ncbi:hypothetical protein AMATHDRAFT_68131 [Amanita thiersii Skay4041]|uniref:Uncharacterized protein n=1 Tax=Amanita thiersii Skay4041 TaxID=703135 RepID=A0A2A9N9K0_9AGAR|nr:hypothetical protein AMATHDRAFT_68131 [Amanita thiersii Skay4041]
MQLTYVFVLTTSLVSLVIARPTGPSQLAKRSGSINTDLHLGHRVDNFLQVRGVNDYTHMADSSDEDVEPLLQSPSRLSDARVDSCWFLVQKNKMTVEQCKLSGGNAASVRKSCLNIDRVKELPNKTFYCFTTTEPKTAVPFVSGGKHVQDSHTEKYLFNQFGHIMAAPTTQWHAGMGSYNCFGTSVIGQYRTAIKSDRDMYPRYS